ncbi:MAG: LCP family protein [Eubacterium sp.]|nr:LCP family protein [Eubacterium sp.]
MSLRKKILSVILTCLLIVVGSGGVYAYTILTQISGIQLDESDLNINANLSEDTVNIALFGIDGRDEVEGDRSDTIMIASVNFKEGTIKIVSVMRDLLVEIPESDKNDTTYEKINAAYQYGGPQLAVKTLNQNFDLNIRDYVVVNFDCLVDVVDALGGVDVNIANEDVLEWTNQFIGHVNYILNRSDPELTGTGNQHLTGVQALAYCRNRYSDNDYMRTERQREVVEQIASKAFNIDLLTAINLMGKVYPYVTTSLSLQEMTAYAKAFMTLENKEFIDFRVPTDQLLAEETIDGVWYMLPNSLADNAIVLHKFLYGTEADSYTPSERLMEISAYIADIGGLDGGITIDTTKSYEEYVKGSSDQGSSATDGSSTSDYNDYDSSNDYGNDGYTEPEYTDPGYSDPEYTEPETPPVTEENSGDTSGSEETPPAEDNSYTEDTLSEF